MTPVIVDVLIPIPNVEPVKANFTYPPPGVVSVQADPLTCQLYGLQMRLLSPTDTVPAARELTDKAIDAGFDNAGLLDTLTVFVPVEAGVYVNVCAAEVLANVRDAGVNVPPDPPSDRVIVPLYTLSGVMVKLPDAWFMTPDDGPLMVYVVADTVVLAE